MNTMITNSKTQNLICISELTFRIDVARHEIEFFECYDRKKRKLAFSVDRLEFLIYHS
ncbi:hypothetical protein PanWU01x14_303540, partial [Parasponia andersonii]